MNRIIPTYTEDGLACCAKHRELPLLASGCCWLCCDQWRMWEERHDAKHGWDRDVFVAKGSAVTVEISTPIITMTRG